MHKQLLCLATMPDFNIPIEEQIVLFKKCGFDGFFTAWTLAELTAKLCGKGFIVSENEGRTVYTLDNICHCKGLTRTRNTEQCLLLITTV